MKNLIANCNHFSALAVSFMLAMGASSQAWAMGQDYLAITKPHAIKTYLYDVQQGNDLTALAFSTSTSGYELSNGDWQSFRAWYQTDWKNLQVTMITELSQSLGLLWGLGSGEKGNKYSIEPNLKLGMVYQTALSPRLHFDMRASVMIGGKLSEDSCTANYGAIGGVQEVNCRLAATQLTPADSLNYLFNQYPNERVEAMMRLRYYF